jgi:hypothetical protein
MRVGGNDDFRFRLTSKPPSMAASIIIGQPYDDSNGILGSQRDAPRQRVKVTIAGNQSASQSGAPTLTTLLRGSALGIVTATGKAVLVNSAHTDGSQTLVGILESDVETANGDVSANVYLSGSFLSIGCFLVVSIL